MEMKEIMKATNIPQNILESVLRQKGIPKLYEWQIHCLELPAIKNRKNLIYSLPTSGGKTLVAEILIVKEMLVEKKNAIFILPYVAIVQEKVTSMASVSLELGFLVEEYAGNKGVIPPQKRRRKKSVFICTIERALGIINSLIEEKRMLEIGMVVVDELHFIGEGSRGALLENLLIKLLGFKDHIQILSMSATIGNLEELSTFLVAEMFCEDFRPVKLSEYVKVENELFTVNQKEYPTLSFHKHLPSKSPDSKCTMDLDGIGDLVNEVLPEKSCLVFCHSKANCENVSIMVCKALSDVSRNYKAEEKSDLIKAFQSEGSGSMCPKLRRTIPFGVAYHHSGLTNAERKLIEEAYLVGTINCICCTSTLAAGINLPAQRVILRSPYLGNTFLSLSKYRQMVGRAGRAGMESRGESFLVCQPTDAEKVGTLLSSKMDSCQSQLLKSDFSCFLLSLLSLKLAYDITSVMDIMQMSLLYIQSKTQEVNIEEEVRNEIERLINYGVIEVINDKLVLSSLGKAAVKGNFSWECANELFNDLKKAQNNIVLLSDLHLLYLITPYSLVNDINISCDVLLTVISQLDQNDMVTAKALGITELVISQLLTGRKVKVVPENILKRFFLSLILHDLWKGCNIWTVSQKFNISRGLINNILSSASSFSSSVVRFCEVLEAMRCFVNLLSIFPQRLGHCCTAELFELMELPTVKMGRAKLLFKAGFTTMKSLANADPKVLVRSVYHLPYNQAKQIVDAAKLSLVMKYENLQEEAENILAECSV